MSTKSRILNYIRRHQNEWVSGEMLSHHLAVSRTAIWKHIRSLKEQGHVIDAVNRQGYRLRQTADVLDAEAIHSGLQTRVLGRREIVCLDQTDSTNLQARTMAIQGAPEGVVVTADVQTAGRGRRSREWLSPRGAGLYVSLILRPFMEPAQAARITLLTAVAASETLHAVTQLSARIKWPNDILVNNRKIAGILTEISADMDTVHYIVVGLGLNVNLTHKDLDVQLNTIATSILMESGQQFNRADLLSGFLNHMEARYQQFKQDGFAPILDRWRQMTDILGQRVNVDLPGIRYTGIAQDVDADGALILQDDDGETRRIISGDVQRLRIK